MSKVNNKDTVIASLVLTLDIFHNFEYVIAGWDWGDHWGLVSVFTCVYNELVTC